jgi:hypothetical protein
MRTPLKTLLAVALLSWFLIGLACDAASVFGNHHAKHIGLSAPNHASGQVVPLEVCDYHGPCWTFYVTPRYAQTQHILDDVALWWIASMGLVVILMAIRGYRLQKRRAVANNHLPAQRPHDRSI